MSRRQRASAATRRPRATGLPPADPDAWLALAQSRLLLGDTVAASAAFRSALIAAPQLKRYAQHPAWGMIPAPVALDALRKLPGAGALWDALPDPAEPVPAP